MSRHGIHRGRHECKPIREAQRFGRGYRCDYMRIGVSAIRKSSSRSKYSQDVRAGTLVHTRERARQAYAAPGEPDVDTPTAVLWDTAVRTPVDPARPHSRSDAVHLRQQLATLHLATSHSGHAASTGQRTNARAVASPGRRGSGRRCRSARTKCALCSLRRWCPAGRVRVAGSGMLAADTRGPVIVRHMKRHGSLQCAPQSRHRRSW